MSLLPRGTGTGQHVPMAGLQAVLADAGLWTMKVWAESPPQREAAHTSVVGHVDPRHS